MSFAFWYTSITANKLKGILDFFFVSFEFGLFFYVRPWRGHHFFFSKFWLFFCFNYITFNEGGVGSHFFEGAGFLWFGVLSFFASLQWGWGVQHVMTQPWLLKANKPHSSETVYNSYVDFRPLWRMISNIVRILVLPCFL